MFGSKRKRSMLAMAACFAFAMTSGPLDARRKPAGPPGTGLAGIAFAKAPPDFAFHTPSGIARLRGLVGTPVVLNFWATWCEPCEAELETFARLRAAYGSHVPLLAISAEAPGVARTRLAAEHIDAIAVDDDGHRIADLYAVSAIPVTLVLGRDGRVAHVSIGQIDWPELREAVAPLVDLTQPPADLTTQTKSGTVGVNAGTPAP